MWKDVGLSGGQKAPRAKALGTICPPALILLCLAQQN